MEGYLIDANLPYRFSLWNQPGFTLQRDLGSSAPDIDLWTYAAARDLTIVTKDQDFADLAMRHTPPPRVILLRIGNMPLRQLHEFLNRVWPEVTDLSARHKLVSVFPDRLEGID